MKMYNKKIAYGTLPDSEMASTVMAELKYHHDNDQIIKGVYWEKGKGCAVGCLLKSGRHIEYEVKFGIPVLLARLEDTLFEGLESKASKLWPQRFMGAALAVGESREERMKLLTQVGWQFFHWMVADELPKSVIGEGKVFEDVRESIAQVAETLKPLADGRKVDAAELARVSKAAHAAAADAHAAHAANYAAAVAYRCMADKLIELIEAAITQEEGG